MKKRLLILFLCCAWSAGVAAPQNVYVTQKTVQKMANELQQQIAVVRGEIPKSLLIQQKKTQHAIKKLQEMTQDRFDQIMERLKKNREGTYQSIQDLKKQLSDKQKQINAFKEKTDEEIGSLKNELAAISPFQGGHPKTGLRK